MYKSVVVERAARKVRLNSARPMALESLEARRMFATTTLSNGGGDGTLSVVVDAFGSYGSATAAGNATYNPIGVIGASGTTFESGVFFTPIGQFLSEDMERTGVTGLTGVAFTSSSASSAVSAFDQGNFHFVLTQTVDPIDTRGQTLFRQEYVITNNTGSTQTFQMIRHVDGDMSFIGGLGNDLAGASVDGRFIFEFDQGSTDEASAFFGLTSEGGTHAGYTVQSFDYVDNIITADGIPAPNLNQINGDTDADRLTNAGYDVTLSLANSFTLNPGETATYEAITIFGQGIPLSVISPGEFVVDPASATVSEGGDEVTITVNRVRGSLGAVSVDYATANGTAIAGQDYVATSGTFSFGDGETSATVTISILNDSLAESLEQFTLSLSNPTGDSAIASPSSSTVTITDDDSTFWIATTLNTVRETSGFARVDVIRGGVTDGEVSVAFTTTDGTATAGLDYTSASQTITFADGEARRTVLIPILTDALTEATETLTVGIQVINSGSLGSPATATLNITDYDTTSPTIEGVSLIAPRGPISGVSIQFSEAINYVPLSGNFRILSRGPLGVGREITIRLRTDSYDSATRTLTLVPFRPLPMNQIYQLSVSGAGVTDIFGNALDADSNGTAGGDYLSYFARGRVIRYMDQDGDLVRLAVQGPGLLEMTRGRSWDARSVQLIGAGTGTVLLGTVTKPRRSFSNGMTILESLTGADSVANNLVLPKFQVGLSA